jgi:hypothetical protein
MAGFDPYVVDEIVAQSGNKENFFGLISHTRADEPELFGYEVTMSGRLVLPELRPRGEDESETGSQVVAC